MGIAFGRVNSPEAEKRGLCEREINATLAPRRLAGNPCSATCVGSDMAELALRRMSLDEVLLWEDGSDTRYELIEGVPVAMAPPAGARGILSARLAGMLEVALRPRRPCTVRSGAGIRRPDSADTFYVADLAVTCRPHQRGEQLVEEPILVVEILSPGAERHDRQTKIPGYREIDSVMEILLIDSEAAYAEIRRRDGSRWITELVQGVEATLSLTSVALQAPLAELYEGIDLAPAA
jgi:Uma2 family endonuclease